MSTLETRAKPLRTDVPRLTALRLANAAEALDVSDSTIRNWIREKKIRAVKLGGGYRIPISEVERIIREVEGPALER